MIAAHLPVLQVVVPLVAAPFCLLCRRGALAWALALLVSWAALAFAWLLLQQVLAGGTVSYELGGWAAPWGIEYRVDALNAYVILIVAAMGAVVLPYAQTSVARELPAAQHAVFYTAFLLCLSGLLGVAITGDAFNLFVFLEISSLSSYVLIALGRHRKALHAAFQYLVMGTIGATFIVIGIGLLYMVTGTLNMVDLAARVPPLAGNRTVLAAFAFLTVGAGLKLALFPLHLWLPNAYAYAPSAVTAFLAATATKVSIYILLRFFFTVFGVEYAFELLTLENLLIPLAVAAVLVCSTVAIFQRDVKRMLAYSSIAQIGYMILGIGLATGTGLTAGIVHLFNHAVTKGGLFLALGCVFWALGSVRLDDMAGLGRRMPLTMFAFVLGGLSLIGVPLTAGFVSKWYLVQAALEVDSWLLAAVVLYGSLLAIVYVWRVVEVAYFRPAPAGDGNGAAREAPLSLLIPTWLLIAASLYFGVETSLSVGVAHEAALYLLGQRAVSAEDAILLSVLVPLAGALLIALAGSRPNLREAVTLATAGLLFLCVVSLVPEVREGGRPQASPIEMLPGLPLRFEVEPLGMLFALVASGLWIVNSLYSIGYMRGNAEKNQTRFYVCFAIALASTMGVAFAGNMMTLFVFYEALTLSTYPLVTHKGDEAARKGGRTYLGILLSTSIGLQLLAILWTWEATGTLDFTRGGILAGRVSEPVVGVLLFLYMYGIGKAALMPLHRWLPAAMVAPTPVSALLHAVAVVKAGVFTVMKVVVYIFGIDLLAETGFGEWLAWVAAITLIGASLVAMTKDNLKARLAYSTVSQLAYVVLGAALATSWGVIGGSMHIAMHAMGKITLFFCAGAIYTAAHKTEISEMGGLGRVMPVTFGAFLIGALSIVGLPPLGGSWSKWYLMLGAAEADQLVMVAVLMVSSLLNVAYLVPIAARGFLSPAPPEPQPAAAGAAAAPRGRIREAPMFCVVPLALTALGCVALFFFADPVYRLLEPIALP